MDPATSKDGIPARSLLAVADIGASEAQFLDQRQRCQQLDSFIA